MPPKIIALGDSLTYGSPFGNAFSWVERVSQTLGIPLINAGVNGNTFWDMGQRLLVDVIDQNPDYVILLGGANDIYQGTPSKTLEERYEKIVKTLLENKIRPILALPPPIRIKNLEKTFILFRLFIKRLAKKKSLPLINFYECFFMGGKRINPTFFEDKVHPSALGYQQMTDVAILALQKILR